MLTLIGFLGAPTEVHLVGQTYPVALSGFSNFGLDAFDYDQDDEIENQKLEEDLEKELLRNQNEVHTQEENEIRPTGIDI